MILRTLLRGYTTWEDRFQELTKERMKADDKVGAFRHEFGCCRKGDLVVSWHKNVCIRSGDSRNEGVVTLCDDSIVYISPAKRSCVGSTRPGASS